MVNHMLRLMFSLVIHLRIFYFYTPFLLFFIYHILAQCYKNYQIIKVTFTIIWLQLLIIAVHNTKQFLSVVQHTTSDLIMQHKHSPQSKNITHSHSISRSPTKKILHKTFQTNHSPYSHCSLCHQNEGNSRNNSPKLSPKSHKYSRYPSEKSNVQTYPQKRTNQQSISKMMKKNREKLCNTLDAYLLILQTNSPMRCLEHNSVLSLYCETQQKLLCANCVYRSQSHKLHKVQPIQQCYRMLARDIELIQRQTSRQISTIDTAEQQINQIFKQQQRNAAQSIIALAHQFQEIQDKLRKYFDEIKLKIVATLDKLCYKQESLLLQLGFFKDILKHNQLPVKQQLASVDQSRLIYYHLIGNTLMSNNKLSKSKLRLSRDHIKQIERSQLRRLQKMKLQLTSWLQQKQSHKDMMPVFQTIKQQQPQTPIKQQKIQQSMRKLIKK